MRKSFVGRSSWFVLSAMTLALAGCTASEPPPDVISGDGATAPGIVDAPPLPELGTVPMNAVGDFQYIVDLRDGSADGYSTDAPDDGRFPSYEIPEARNLIYDFESKYGFNATSMTSLVGLSFTAFLSLEQIEAIRRDGRVAMISSNHYIEPSSDSKSVWIDQYPNGGEKVPWGKMAMNPNALSSSGTVRVYVVDFGTGYHPDLNIIKQIRPNMQIDPQFAHAAGCYPHGAHVAGIIGAKVNGAGTQGVAPGVSIVSVLVQDELHYDWNSMCITDRNTPGSVKDALEWVASDVKNRGKVGIVNISFNDPAFKASGTLGIAMEWLAHKPLNYPNAFIAHSAGNRINPPPAPGVIGNACDVAYDAPSDTDGIMVVGAINDHGQQVVPLNGLPGLYEYVSFATKDPFYNNEMGSNYGPCVDAWAPGRSIYSTWEKNDYARLSGTSMAAPHVAGLAAYIAETEGAANASELETKVRAKLKYLGSFDKSVPPIPIQMPSLVPLPSPSNTPYAEVRINSSKVPNPPAAPVYADTNKNFTLRLDSRGVDPYGCDLIRTRIDQPSVPEQFVAPTQKTPLQTYNWNEGIWEISSSMCPSAHAKIVYTNKPKVHWIVNGIQSSDKSMTLSTLTTDSLVLGYTSENTVSCSLDVKYYDNPGAGVPSQTWGQTSGPNSGPNVLKANTPGHYVYDLKCSDTYGTPTYGTFDLTLTAPLPPPPGPLGAKFVAQSVPSQVNAGQLVPVSITIANQGTTPWTDADSFALGSLTPGNDKTWGWNRIKLAPGETVEPGQTKTFTFDILAPYNPANYVFQWQMLHNGAEFFGDASPSTTVAVTLPPSLIQPKTGTWHNPNRAGPKLSIGRNNSAQVLFIWHTFTPEGKPTWYYGLHGKKNNGVYSSDQTAEGMFSTQRTGGAVKINPKGQMYFAPIDANKGTFSWEFLDGNVGAERIEYEGVNSGASLGGTGHWYPPSQSGWGLSLDLQGNSAKTLVTFYDASGQPTWAWGTGGPSGNGYFFSLVSFTGTNLCPGCMGPTSVSSMPNGWLTVDTINNMLGTSLVPFPGAPPLQNGNLPIQLLTY